MEIKRNPSQDGCPDTFIRQIEDYLNGVLTDKEMERFEQAYFNHDSCLEELQLRRELKALVLEEGQELFVEFLPHEDEAYSLIEKSPDSRRRGVPGHYWIYSAVAAVFVLFAALYGFRDTPAQPDPPAPVFSSSFPEGQTGREFQPSSYFEARAAYTMRGSGVTLLEPDSNLVYGGELTFRWEMDKRAAQKDPLLYLVIFTNREEPVLRASLSGGEFTFRNHLEPGLYYWTLENAETTIHIGRFVVVEKTAAKTP